MQDLDASVPCPKAVYFYNFFFCLTNGKHTALKKNNTNNGQAISLDNEEKASKKKQGKKGEIGT